MRCSASMQPAVSCCEWVIMLQRLRRLRILLSVILPLQRQSQSKAAFPACARCSVASSRYRNFDISGSSSSSNCGGVNHVRQVDNRAASGQPSCRCRMTLFAAFRRAGTYENVLFWTIAFVRFAQLRFAWNYRCGSYEGACDLWNLWP